MFLGKSKGVKISDEFPQARRLVVEQEFFFFCLGNRDSQRANHPAMPDRPFDPAFLAAMLNALSGGCGAETPAVAQQVDGFQEVRLTLPILPAKEIRSRTELYFLLTEVAVLIETEVEYLHI